MGSVWQCDVWWVVPVLAAIQFAKEKRPRNSLYVMWMAIECGTQRTCFFVVMAVYTKEEGPNNILFSLF